MNESIETLLTLIIAAQVEQIAHRDWASQPLTNSRKSYATCEADAFNRIAEISVKVRKATVAPKV